MCVSVCVYVCLKTVKNLIYITFWCIFRYIKTYKYMYIYISILSIYVYINIQQIFNCVYLCIIIYCVCLDVNIEVMDSLYNFQ